MHYRIDHALEILRRTPRILRAQLKGLDETWVRSNYGPDTFSPFDVVGHFVHGEKVDWICRTKIILEHGESRPFDDFDRYAMHEDSRGKSIDDLLDEFESRRNDNLAELESMNITEEQFTLTGTHPDFGRVQLGHLLATWVVHDLHHLAQICKAMSYQYRDEIGPWREYIGIVPR